MTHWVIRRLVRFQRIVSIRQHGVCRRLLWKHPFRRWCTSREQQRCPNTCENDQLLVSEVHSPSVSPAESLNMDPPCHRTAIDSTRRNARFHATILNTHDCASVGLWRKTSSMGARTHIQESNSIHHISAGCWANEPSGVVSARAPSELTNLR